MLWFWATYGIIMMGMAIGAEIECKILRTKSPFSSNPMTLLVQLILGPIALVYKLIITINRKGR